MDDPPVDDPPVLPGTTKPRRFVPRFHYELLVCGTRGHELIGTDARTLRESDHLIAREGGEEPVRWYRCLRCDSWLPLPPPTAPTRDVPPERDDIALPLRGRPLRDKIVLRLIAINRAFHCLVFSLLAAAIFLFAANQGSLRQSFYRVISDLQGPIDASHPAAHHGLEHELDRLFSLQSGTLQLAGAVLVAYAVLEGSEAVGLWLQKRWAEYLTFIATTALLPLEIYELSNRVSPFKVLALIINLAVLAYLLWAKRLFGLNGGAAADEALRERDLGWGALERSAPGVAGAETPAPSAS